MSHDESMLSNTTVGTLGQKEPLPDNPPSIEFLTDSERGAWGIFGGAMSKRPNTALRVMPNHRPLQAKRQKPSGTSHSNPMGSKIPLFGSASLVDRPRPRDSGSWKTP